MSTPWLGTVIRASPGGNFVSTGGSVTTAGGVCAHSGSSQIHDSPSSARTITMFLIAISPETIVGRPPHLDLPHELFQFPFRNHVNAQLPSFVQLRSGIAPRNDVVRLLAHRPRDTAPGIFDHLFRFVSGVAFECARQHKSFARQLGALLFFLPGERQSCLAQIAYQFAIVIIGEEFNDAFRDSWAHFVDFLKLLGARVHDSVEASEVFRQELRGALAYEPYPEAVNHSLERQLL